MAAENSTASLFHLMCKLPQLFLFTD